MSAKLFFICASLLYIVNAAEDNIERRDTYWYYKKPSATRFTLINTVTQLKIYDVYDGTKIDICKLAHLGIHSPAQINFGVDTTGAASVDFYLNNKFYRQDPQYFFSLCGDNGGYPYYGCKDLSYGHQCFTAKPWSGSNGKGICGDKLTVCVDIVGCPAPVMPPVRPPVRAPVPAPIPAPIPAPVLPPKAAPVQPPVHPPVPAPVKPPVRAPVPAPVMPPKAAPVRPPVHPPVPAPVKPPVRAPVPAPVMPPKAAPVRPPVHPPVPAPVKPPVRAPVPAPVMPPKAAPVTAPVRAPVVIHPVPAPKCPPKYKWHV
jgi:hypothetical protein